MLRKLQDDFVYNVSCCIFPKTWTKAASFFRSTFLLFSMQIQFNWFMQINTCFHYIEYASPKGNGIPKNIRTNNHALIHCKFVHADVTSIYRIDECSISNVEEFKLRNDNCESASVNTSEIIQIWINCELI